MVIAVGFLRAVDVVRNHVGVFPPVAVGILPAVAVVLNHTVAVGLIHVGIIHDVSFIAAVAFGGIDAVDDGLIHEDDVRGVGIISSAARLASGLPLVT